MQALRHASRRALHASVMQETFGASLKAYSSEAASPVAARKTKEERFELAKQFVAKFKAANNGQLPGITLLRKEVGGKYETLKEVLQELAKGQGEPDTPKQTVELKDAEEKTQELAAASKDGKKKKLPLKEDSEKDKTEMLQISKGSKVVKSVEPAHSRTTSKDIQSVMPGKDGSKLLMDIDLITDEDDDDSDVAAPEYYRSPLMKMAHHKMEEGVKAAKGKEKVLENGAVAHGVVKKQNDGQALKSKHADIKQPEVQDGGIKIELPHKAQDADDTATKHLSTDGSVGFGSKYGPVPLTTIARIINLPLHITASKLKAICETVARVHEVEIRRKHIADVHFNVDLEEMSNVLSRLKFLSIGTTKLRVFSAHKFSCGNSEFKPKDVHHYRQVRNILFFSLEQRFKFLSSQVQDYRELQELKLKCNIPIVEE